MLATFALLSLLIQGPTQTVTLENAATLHIGNESHQYWGTSDTFLDSNSPLENNGDSHVLEGGPGKTILLKFGDLEQLGRHKVVKATLYLTPSAEGKPHLATIRSLSLPWGEGPLRRPFFTDKPLVAADWSATWKQRHSGVQGMDWQQNGASGPADAKVIDGATMTDDGKEIAISGLEGAVQNMLDKWYENNGFALFFSAPTEFFSSKNVVTKPRLVLELADEPPATGPDLSVTLIEARLLGGVSWPPRDGTQVTYIAHVKNVGDAPAKGFTAAWNVREHLGSGFEVSKTLAPGAETTGESTQPYQSNSSDHRQQGLGLLITPTGGDANASNNYLEIQQDALPVVAASSSQLSEDATQKLARQFNDDLAHSTFSFAPEGSMERIRIASFDDSATFGLKDPSLAHWLAHEMHFDYSKMNPKVSKVEGHDIALDSADRWPGILGGGSTANDISVPGEIQLPYVADYNEVFDQYELEPTGLLAATEMAVVNSSLGKPFSRPKLPGTVLIRALNSDGDALPSTELRFYQTKNGEVQTDQPTFRLITGEGGSVLLPNRVSPDGKSDAFGGLLPDGSNGVYFVAATVNGTTDYAWIKAWQLADSFSRTGKPAVFVELRFNVPYQPIDTETNLASGKAITDSEKDEAATLGKLVDGDASAAVDLPNKKGEWLEIDLGKDQSVTEIDVLGKDPTFWQRFDVMTYFTGETIQQASPYSHEVDWAWNLKTRPVIGADGSSGLVYRGSGKGVRYIRFVCKTPGAGDKAHVAEIKVFGPKAG